MDSSTVLAWLHDVYSSSSSPPLSPYSPEHEYHNQTSTMPRSPKKKVAPDPASDPSQLDNDSQRDSGDNSNQDGDPFTTPRAPVTSALTTRSRSMQSYSVAQVTSFTSFPRSPTKSTTASSSYTRSTSPVKQTDDLVRLDKPVYSYGDISTENLMRKLQQHGPASVDLLIKIKAALRIGYLPIELREILDTEMCLGEHEYALYAKRPPLPVPNISMLRDANFLISTTLKSLLPSSQRNNSKTDEFLPDFLHLQSLISELDMLRKIVSTTKDYGDRIRAEASWNEQVHGRMLELAVLHAPGVGVENITRANIAKEFLPPISDHNRFSAPSSKLIDYAMVLQPLDLLRAEIAENISDNKRLSLSRMVSFVDKLDYPSFNQSSYAPLRSMPSGIFIETKINSQKSSEATAQLGIWLASWHNRVSKFPRSDKHKGLPSPVLPVLKVDSSSWRLGFAFDMDSHYEVCGGINIGSTDDLDDAYRLLSVLRVLTNWMATDFYDWVDSCLKEAGL
ncbi:hypothetical protein F4859DRAFT_479332 [Xylaria cf. heliscus]|nr:hypothetical protein F4859DRAFT_479332 [Xylaria cf. heliscus]